ncbi:hypothetical protein CEXT_422301 [Caerostris extrusa]|uniref:Uncharacterized protein n=1 Tax=Caerostris extrusa TaxID=172846 RepID=A0AAV4U9W2_CAEEX|nr:hypothetical protein CEXT_422301 [Caerostris extrusa]
MITVLQYFKPIEKGRLSSNIFSLVRLLEEQNSCNYYGFCLEEASSPEGMSSEICFSGYLLRVIINDFLMNLASLSCCETVSFPGNLLSCFQSRLESNFFTKAQ